MNEGETLCQELAKKLCQMRAERDRLRKERDSYWKNWQDCIRYLDSAEQTEMDLRSKNETLTETLKSVLDDIGPWKTECDYRAEPYIKSAVTLILAALQEDRDEAN